MVNTQFNNKIKTIRSDDGTEFYLKDFFHSNGILHQLSCVDTLQQNAVVVTGIILSQSTKPIQSNSTK